MEKHPELVESISHWTKAVYLIVKGDERGVVAINLTRMVDGAPNVTVEQAHGMLEQAAAAKARGNAKVKPVCVLNSSLTSRPPTRCVCSCNLTNNR